MHPRCKTHTISFGECEATKTKKKVKIHCNCKLPENASEEMMSKCPKCNGWYHQSCQSIPDETFDGRLVLHMSLCIIIII